METKKQKQFYVIVNGQRVEVTEEVYRAYVRPVRAQQRTEKRNKRCKVKGERFGLVRCHGDCSKCEYARSGKALGGAEQSLEALTESGFEPLCAQDLEEDFIDRQSYEEKITILRTAIRSLNKCQQYIIKEIYVNGKTREEIAKDLGVDGSAVRHALQRILVSLPLLLYAVFKIIALPFKALGSASKKLKKRKKEKRGDKDG